MELNNYTLNRIKEILDEVLQDYPDTCTCEQCRYDIIAMAANKLKPQYVVSEKGQVYAKTNTLSQQSRADVLAEVVIAVEKVSRNPHHQQDK